MFYLTSSVAKWSRHTLQRFDVRRRAPMLVAMSLLSLSVGALWSGSGSANEKRHTMNGVRVAIGFPTPRPTPSPTPTPTPTSAYVFDRADYTENLDPSGNDAVCSASASSGSISAQASDNFTAGVWSSAGVNASRTDSVTTTFHWHWNSPTGLPPADYIPIYSSSYKGSVSQNFTGSSTGSISGSSGGGGVDGNNPGYSNSWVSYGNTQLGSANISLSQTLSLSTGFQMDAHNGSANGSINHSASGSIHLAQ